VAEPMPSLGQRTDSAPQFKRHEHSLERAALHPCTANVRPEMGMARPCSFPVRRRASQGISNRRSTSHVTFTGQRNEVIE
jgi:hypothetical protein